MMRWRRERRIRRVRKERVEFRRIMRGKCKHEYEWSSYCGAYVCSKCRHHRGLAVCFCGWGNYPDPDLDMEDRDY